MIRGSIPYKITYINRPPHKFERKFEDGTLMFEPVTASSSFVSDAENKKTLATGIRWGTIRTSYSPSKVVKTYLTEEQAKNHTDRWSIYYDEAKNQWYTRTYDRGTNLAQPVELPPVQETVENTPIKGARILCLEHRGNGGRAYKVLIGERVFDLREDVLLDIMLSSSIKDGVIDAELIWCKVGSEMKLVRVGSALHKLLEKSAQLAQELVPIKDLSYGGVYQTKTQTLVYLGRHKSVECIEERAGRGYGYGYTYRLKEREPMHVFVQISENQENLIRLGNIKATMNPYFFKFVKSKPKAHYKGDIENLPKIEDLVKAMVVAEKEKRVKEITERSKNGYSPSKPTSYIKRGLTIGKDMEETKKMIADLNSVYVETV